VAGPTALRRSTPVFGALGAVGVATAVTAALARTLATGSGATVYGALGVAAILALALVARLPHLAVAGLLVFVQVQAALKFYVSNTLGPAKDAATLLVVAVVVGAAVLTRSGRARPVDRWLLAAIGVLVAIYLLDPAGGRTAGWSPAVRLVVESLGLFVAGWLAPDPRRTWRWAAGALVGTGVVQSLLGVGEQLLGADRLVTDLGLAYGAQVRTTSGGQLRSFGTFDDPFNYGAITTIALVVAATTVRRAWLRTALVAVLAVGVVTSVDRTMLALLPVLLLAWLALHGRVRLAALVLAVGVAGGVGYLALPSAPAPPQVVQADAPQGGFLLTLNGRTQTWSQVVRGLQDVPFGRGVGVLGTGLARSQAGNIATQQRYVDGVAPDAASNTQLTSLDNSYLQVVADVGLLGLAVLLVAGARVCSLLRPGVRRRSPPALAGAGILLVVAVDGLTRTSLTAFPFGFVALLALGSALAAARQPDARR
jgi:hypothetical protein